jgi:hypothetical protein
MGRVIKSPAGGIWEGWLELAFSPRGDHKYDKN